MRGNALRSSLPHLPPAEPEFFYTRPTGEKVHLTTNSSKFKSIEQPQRQNSPLRNTFDQIRSPLPNKLEKPANPKDFTQPRRFAYADTDGYDWKNKVTMNEPPIPDSKFRMTGKNLNPLDPEYAHMHPA